jgi:hypothetical protein
VVIPRRWRRYVGNHFQGHSVSAQRDHDRLLSLLPDQCLSNGGTRTPGGPRHCLIVFFSSNEKACEMKHIRNKGKIRTAYFKYFTKYVYLSRIHIVNSCTWLYFYLSLYVARSFTNGNFGITGASEMVPTPFVSISSVDRPIRFKFPIAPIVSAPLRISVHKYTNNFTCSKH